MVRLLVGLILAALATVDAQASLRVALVVGNARYEHVDPLKNADRDARDIAAKLKELGFETFLAENVSKVDFDLEIRKFVTALDEAETALFFYSGHGVQVDGVNYLIPLDSKLESTTDVVLDSVPLQDILRLMQRSAKSAVVLLDACQNDPFKTRGVTGGAKGVSVIGGLAAEGGSAGTYISFATQPGQFSYDGTGSNSPFTKALIKHMAQPQVDIRIVMSDVRKDVIEETRGAQVPWENNALTGRLYLNPSPAAATKGLTVEGPQTDAEQLAWAKIVSSENASDYIDFLDAYPNGLFGETARAQLRRLLAKPGGGTPQTSVARASDASPETVLSSPGAVEPLIVGRQPLAESIEYLDPSGVRSLQQQLIRVGCLESSADGRWGMKSAQALDRFRSIVTGAYDLDTLEAALSSAKPGTCKPKPSSAAKPSDEKKTPPTKKPIVADTKPSAAKKPEAEPKRSGVRLSPFCKKLLASMPRKPKPKAMARTLDGRVCTAYWGQRSQTLADSMALAGCSHGGRHICMIVRR